MAVHELHEWYSRQQAGQLWVCWGDKLYCEAAEVTSWGKVFTVYSCNRIFRNKELLPSTIQVLAIILLFSFWQSAQVICAGVRKIYWYCPFSSNPALIKVLLKTYQFCQKFWINLAEKKEVVYSPQKSASFARMRPFVSAPTSSPCAFIHWANAFSTSNAYSKYIVQMHVVQVCIQYKWYTAM